MERDRLFELYLSVRSEQVEWMNRHGQNFRYYVTLIAAMLAATLGALYQFRGSPQFSRLAAVLGFGLNAGLCVVAILACNRSYQRFLEAVTITAKLESFLGLDGARPETAVAGKKGRAFPEDTSLLPDRWLKSRDEVSSADFIARKMNRGANLLTRVTMVILFTLNFVLLLRATLMPM
jgi:hypothetical protein